MVSISDIVNINCGGCIHIGDTNGTSLVGPAVEQRLGMDFRDPENSYIKTEYMFEIMNAKESATLVLVGDNIHNYLLDTSLTGWEASVDNFCTLMGSYNYDYKLVTGNWDCTQQGRGGADNTNWESYLNRLETNGITTDYLRGYDGRAIYSWEEGGILFISLDTNHAYTDNLLYGERIGMCTFYTGSPFYYEENNIPDHWAGDQFIVPTEFGSIGPRQLSWLGDLLSQNKEKCVVIFAHAPLEGDFRFVTADYKEFQETLRVSGIPGQKIICITGHYHPGNINAVVNDVRYVSMKGMILGTTDTMTTVHSPWYNKVTKVETHITSQPTVNDVPRDWSAARFSFLPTPGRLKMNIDKLGSHSPIYNGYALNSLHLDVVGGENIKEF